jgi:hypothetical protein
MLASNWCGIHGSPGTWSHTRRDQCRFTQARKNPIGPSKVRLANPAPFTEGAFNRVFCDEDHTVKTISTQVHQTVTRLAPKYFKVLSATLLHNSVLDLCGYLAIIYSAVLDEMRLVQLIHGSRSTVTVKKS